MRLRLLALCLLVGTATGPAFGAAAATADPSALVVGLSVQLRQILADGSLTPSERQQRFRGLLDAGFDFPRISRFVLGHYWQGSSDASRQQFAAVFEDYVIQSLGGRLSDYSGESMNVTAARAESDRDTLVSTAIIHPDGSPPAKVDWQVLDTPGGLKITDVSVAGISMVISYRDQFAAVMDRDGGQISALIADLRAKLDEQPSSSASANNTAPKATP